MEMLVGHFHSDFPIMGVGLYLLIEKGLNGGTHKMRERYAEIDSKLLPMLPRQSRVFKQNKKKIRKQEILQVTYKGNSRYPIYQNTDIKYFDEAVKGLEAQLEEPWRKHKSLSSWNIMR